MAYKSINGKWVKEDEQKPNPYEPIQNAELEEQEEPKRGRPAKQ